VGVYHSNADEKTGTKKRKQSDRLVLVQRAACYRTSQKKKMLHIMVVYTFIYNPIRNKISSFGFHVKNDPQFPSETEI